MSRLRASLVVLCILALPGWCEALCAWQHSPAAVMPPGHCGAHDRAEQRSSVSALNAPEHCAGDTTPAPRLTTATKQSAPTPAVFTVVSTYAVRGVVLGASTHHNLREHVPPGVFVSLRI